MFKRLPICSNEWINYLNSLLSRLNGGVKQIMSNTWASCLNGWKYYQPYNWFYLSYRWINFLNGLWNCSEYMAWSWNGQCCCVLFSFHLSLLSISRPLFSQSKKEIISISHQFKMRAELIVVVRFSHIDLVCNVSTAVEKRWVHFLILNRWIEGSGMSNRSNGWCSSLHWHF